MLLMVEIDIRGGICKPIQRYPAANNKYIKYYGNNKESSYLKYWECKYFIWLGNVAKCYSK